MPPPTPLPVIAQLIGLFRQGFWRRLAGRLFRSKAAQQAEDAVEDFLLPILEAISRIAEAVQNGTYREPEYSPWPNEPPETSGWTPPPKPPPIRKPEREPAPPWLCGPRPRRPTPPPAPEPAAEQSSSAPQAPSRPARQRPSWPPARPAARRPLPPPRVRIRSKKARPEPVKTHAQFVPL